jgi:hypothetical protein
LPLLRAVSCKLAAAAAAVATVRCLATTAAAATATAVYLHVLMLLLPLLLELAAQLFWRTKCIDFNVKTCFATGEITKAFRKTFVERQSWVLVLFSFWRIYAFHIVAIHVMINLARCDLGTSPAACTADQLLQPVTTLYACMLLKEAHDFISALIMFLPHRSVSQSAAAAVLHACKTHTY